MNFFKLLLIGFRAKPKERLYSVILGLAFVMFFDMYFFNPETALYSMFLWVISIKAFGLLKVHIGSSIALANCLVVLSWGLTHYNEKILNNTQNLLLGLLVFWLVETFVVYRNFKK